MNYVFIINPVAGKGGQADGIAEKIRDFFKDRDDNIHIYLTKSPGDSTRFGKEYPIPEGEKVCFVACGGDGTFYGVVNGIFGRSGASVAVYPCGSGNDFIKSIGGKKDDYFDFQKLVDGEDRVIDTILVNDRICSNICNIGLDSVVCDRMNNFKKIPSVSGPMAYNLSAVTTIGAGLFSSLGTPMRFTFDDGEIIEGNFMLSVFGNGRVYGGGYYPVPEALLDDGKIDFCAVRETGVLKLPKLLAIYKEGKHINSPLFEKILAKRQCTKAKIESSDDLTVCIDGEVFKAKSLDIEIMPSSLTFRVPKFD